MSHGVFGPVFIVGFDQWRVRSTAAEAFASRVETVLGVIKVHRTNPDENGVENVVVSFERDIDAEQLSRELQKLFEQVCDERAV